MALVQIQIPPGDRVIWAKLSQAAKLVAKGLAEYVPVAAPEAPTGVDETLVAKSTAKVPQTMPKKGRR